MARLEAVLEVVGLSQLADSQLFQMMAIPTGQHGFVHNLL